MKQLNDEIRHDLIQFYKQVWTCLKQFNDEMLQSNESRNATKQFSDEAFLAQNQEASKL